MKRLAALLIILFLLLIFHVQAQVTTGSQKLAAFAKQKTMLQMSPYKNLDWRLVGPDNRSGRCSDVAGVTGNPNIMYAAFATGGLWKTEDGGNEWKPLFDNQGTQSMGNIPLLLQTHVFYMSVRARQIFSERRCQSLEFINL